MLLDEKLAENAERLGHIFRRELLAMGSPLVQQARCAALCCVLEVHSVLLWALCATTHAAHMRWLLWQAGWRRVPQSSPWRPSCGQHVVRSSAFF